MLMLDTFKFLTAPICVTSDNTKVHDIIKEEEEEKEEGGFERSAGPEGTDDLC